MSAIAIATMIVTIVIIWGGLIGSIIALRVLPVPNSPVSNDPAPNNPAPNNPVSDGPASDKSLPDDPSAADLDDKLN